MIAAASISFHHQLFIFASVHSIRPVRPNGRSNPAQ
jgi:hypothetical protein